MPRRTFSFPSRRYASGRSSLFKRPASPKSPKAPRSSQAAQRQTAAHVPPSSHSLVKERKGKTPRNVPEHQAFRPPLRPRPAGSAVRVGSLHLGHRRSGVNPFLKQRRRFLIHAPAQAPDPASLRQTLHPSPPATTKSWPPANLQIHPRRSLAPSGRSPKPPARPKSRAARRVQRARFHFGSDRPSRSRPLSAIREFRPSTPCLGKSRPARYHRTAKQRRRKRFRRSAVVQWRGF